MSVYINIDNKCNREELCGPAASQQQISETTWQDTLSSNLSQLFFFFYSFSHPNLLTCYWGGGGVHSARSWVCVIPVLIWWSQSELTIVLSSRKTWRLTTNPERHKTLPVPVLAYKPKQRAQLTRAGGRRPTAGSHLTGGGGAWRGWPPRTRLKSLRNHSEPEQNVFIHLFHVKPRSPKHC